jgi:hypothetical protein
MPSIEVNTRLQNDVLPTYRYQEAGGMQQEHGFQLELDNKYGLSR